jgi:hypothetical protein
VGQQVEVRLRWQAIPGQVRWDTGYTHLFAGRFMKDAVAIQEKGDVNYFYAELTLLV